MANKINLRKEQNFITKHFKQDIANMNKNERGPQERLTNIAWPSESTVTLGPVCVGECKRSMFYKILGSTPTEPMSLTGRRICDAGNIVEDWCILNYKEKGCLKDTQVQIDFLVPNSRNKVQIRGKMDCIIEEDGITNAIEIKSVGEFKSAKIMAASDLPLPSPNNLMQAMLYEYYLTKTEAGKALKVDNVYLRYVNRGTYSDFYYKIKLDEEGYPIITAIDQAGKELYTYKLQDAESLDQLYHRSGEVSKDETRLAELRFRVQDIFDKFDLVYNYTKNKMLPPPDYSIIYNLEELEREYKLGRISKIKYNKVKKGEVLGDSKCSYCAYRTKCLSDSGITMK